MSSKVGYLSSNAHISKSLRTQNTKTTSKAGEEVNAKQIEKDLTKVKQQTDMMFWKTGDKEGKKKALEELEKQKKERESKANGGKQTSTTETKSRWFGWW
jgi:hypothetical protein